MKKLLFSTCLVFLFIIIGITLKAQEISFSFTSEFQCSFRQTDSIIITNLAHGGDTVLYYPDTVLTFIFTGIDGLSANEKDFYVSQNYPNPFESSTDIDVYVPKGDNFSLNVFNTTGRKLTGFDCYLEQGLHSFTFFGANDKSYILTVNSDKYLDQILMIQLGAPGSETPTIVYNGLQFGETSELKTKALKTYFPYNIGDLLSLTGYVTDEYNNVSFQTITDDPYDSHDYLFSFDSDPPQAPAEITGETSICPNTYGLTYEVTEVEGETYYWNFPEDWEITEGQNTFSVTVNAGETGGILTVTASNYCGESEPAELFVNMKQESVAADVVSGAQAICPGGNTVLNVIGGVLGTGAEWTWYKENCGVEVIGTGSFINASPNEPTTYFVRAEGDCNITECKEFTVDIKTLSTAPEGIAGETEVCQGESVELSVVGGSLGTGAEWSWYLHSCGCYLVNTGETYVFTPAVTTNVYVRAEGECNTTAYAMVTVTLKSESYPPSEISGNLEICEGENTELWTTGGYLGHGADWYWYTDIYSPPVYVGNTLQVPAEESVTYYVRAEGDCNITDFVNATLVVKTFSEPANGITGETEICEGQSTLLNVEGGYLGTDAEWHWYTDIFGAAEHVGENYEITPSGTTTYYVRAEGFCNYTDFAEITVTVKSLSIQASGITGETEICQGENTILSVEGGFLGTGAEWYWFTDICGVPEYTGETINVSPEMTTTYYVRAEGECNITEFADITIVVKTLSEQASGVIGETEICEGESTDLNVEGGYLGTDAEWHWYTDIFGAAEHVGENYEVTPSQTTTYYVRAEGDCNITDFVDITVVVQSLSQPASEISGENEICHGESTTLTVTGGFLGNGANWHWYTDIYGAPEYSGETINVPPSETTTYYVRAEGNCNITDFVEITVSIKTLSEVPGDISGDLTICPGESTELTQEGGVLGSGADWFWYTESCGGNLIDTGESIIVLPSETTTFFVRAEGDCNTTNCWAATVFVKTESTEPGGISGENEICPGENITLTVEGGSLGSGAGWKWYSQGCGVQNIGSGPNLYISPEETKNYYVRAEGDCNITNCEELTITVKSLSIDPEGITGDMEVCSGDSATLTVEGGYLGTGATWEWHSVCCGEYSEYSGDTITVFPITSLTQYYVRAEGDCNVTEFVNSNINVKFTPQTPIEGNHITGEYFIEWKWDHVGWAQGYKINDQNDSLSATNIGYNNSYMQQNLDCETTYNLFVWAYNECGLSVPLETSETTLVCIEWSCGDMLIDYRDSQQYATVKIGNQCWMGENLNIGQMILTPVAQNNINIIEKYCYDNDPLNCEIYGGLYQWNQAMNYETEQGSQGICPQGWFLPSDQDFAEMEIFLGMDPGVVYTLGFRGPGIGTQLKQGGTSGFDILYGGAWASWGAFIYIEGSIHEFGYLYTSTQAGEDHAFRRCFRSDNSGVGRYNTWYKEAGLSVRCIKQ